MNILVTGGAGFIGSNFIRYMIKKYPLYRLINIDKLTYSGNLDNLLDVSQLENYEFVQGDICDQSLINSLFENGIDCVVNFAAESHVDRSLTDPGIFIKTNIEGTQILLEASKKYNVRKFIQISTDEVYGTLGDTGLFSEESPIAPNSPYSASKAGSDLIVRAYHQTFGLSVNITRCSNNYGPYQFPEKFIPLMIINALRDHELPLYGDGLNIRDWLHVEDHCSAIDLVLHEGKDGEIYNIGSNTEKTNVEIINTILNTLGKPVSLVKYVEDRLGHDRRYAINASKIISTLGWKPKYTFEIGIRETISWYLDHENWWNNIISGDYKTYYNSQYGSRLGVNE